MASFFLCLINTALAYKKKFTFQNSNYPSQIFSVSQLKLVSSKKRLSNGKDN